MLRNGCNNDLRTLQCPPPRRADSGDLAPGHSNHERRRIGARRQCNPDAGSTIRAARRAMRDAGSLTMPRGTFACDALAHHDQPDRCDRRTWPAARQTAPRRQMHCALPAPRRAPFLWIKCAPCMRARSATTPIGIAPSLARAGPTPTDVAPTPFVPGPTSGEHDGPTSDEIGRSSGPTFGQHPVKLGGPVPGQLGTGRVRAKICQVGLMLAQLRPTFGICRSKLGHCSPILSRNRPIADVIGRAQWPCFSRSWPVQALRDDGAVLQ